MPTMKAPSSTTLPTLASTTEARGACDDAKGRALTVMMRGAGCFLGPVMIGSALAS